MKQQDKEQARSASEPKHVELDFMQMDIRVHWHRTVSFAMKDGKYGSLTEEEALELANAILAMYHEEVKK